MAIALDNTLRNIRLRFVNGQAGQFFQWWIRELRNAMPAQLRARMQYARRRLLMQVGEGGGTRAFAYGHGADGDGTGTGELVGDRYVKRRVRSEVPDYDGAGRLLPDLDGLFGLADLGDVQVSTK